MCGRSIRFLAASPSTGQFQRWKGLQAFLLPRPVYGAVPRLFLIEKQACPRCTIDVSMDWRAACNRNMLPAPHSEKHVREGKAYWSICDTLNGMAPVFRCGRGLLKMSLMGATMRISITQQKQHVQSIMEVYGEVCEEVEDKEDKQVENQGTPWPEISSTLQQPLTVCWRVVVDGKSRDQWRWWCVRRGRGAGTVRQRNPACVCACVRENV